MLLASLALAQTVTAVPPGARGISVFVCSEGDCSASLASFTAHHAALGIPLLDLGAVVDAGPAGGDARIRYATALAALDREPDLVTAQEAAEAMAELPLTLPAEEVWRLHLRLGDALLAEGRRSEADGAFARAASASGNRVTDLPGLSQAGIARYVDATQRNDTGVVTMTGTGTPYVDGVPLRDPVLAGWHRVSMEWGSARTAWVTTVSVPAGATLQLTATPPVDSEASLNAALTGLVHGDPAPQAILDTLSRWGQEQGLTWIRVVSPTGAGTPEERLPQGPPLHAAWIDVGSRRVSPRGPGPGVLRLPDPDRFRLGLGLGYLHLGRTLAIGPDPHDHATIEFVALVRLATPLALDLRLGLWHSAQPYYLYDTWTDENLYPVSAGLRVHTVRPGPYAGAHATAVIPFAIGGDLFAGWEVAPTPRLRLGLEGRAGLLDRGWTAAGALMVAWNG